MDPNNTDVDDLDDLDDVLDQFKATAAPSKTSSGPSATLGQPSAGTHPVTSTASGSSETQRNAPQCSGHSIQDDDEGSDDDDPCDELPADFAQELAEGMDAFFKSLSSGDEGGEAFKKQLEALLDPQGSAFGSTHGGQGHPSGSVDNNGPRQDGASASSTNESKTNKSFQDTVLGTMSKLKESDESAKRAGAAASSEEEALAAMMEQMMKAGGGGSGETDDDLQQMLLGFMDELMSKQIMYPPLKELSKSYPEWISQNRSKLQPADLKRYQDQDSIVQQIVLKFEDPGWDADEAAASSTPGPAPTSSESSSTNTASSKTTFTTKSKESKSLAKDDVKEGFKRRQAEVTELMMKMQDCGAPPQELLGDMPPGMQLGADGMPDLNQCIIS